MPKRKIYNFKKANWQDLNHTLKKIPWDQVLDNREPEYRNQLFQNSVQCIYNFTFSTDKTKIDFITVQMKLQTLSKHFNVNSTGAHVYQNYLVICYEWRLAPLA